jgi:hypothetical protein
VSAGSFISGVAPLISPSQPSDASQCRDVRWSAVSVAIYLVESDRGMPKEERGHDYPQTAA